MYGRGKKFLAGMLVMTLVAGMYPGEWSLAEEIPLDDEIVEVSGEAAVEATSENESFSGVDEIIVDQGTSDVGVPNDTGIAEGGELNEELVDSDDLILSEELLEDPETETVESEYLVSAGEETEISEDIVETQSEEELIEEITRDREADGVREIYIEKTLESAFIAGKIPESGVSLFSLKSYSGCFGNQLENLALEIYQACVNNYVTGKATGEFTYTLKTPITFAAEIVGEEVVETAEMQELQMAMQAALDAFLYDHPEVFWVKGYSTGYYMSISGDVGTISRIAITLTEIYEGASSGVSAYDTAVANTVNTIRSDIGNNASRYDTVKYIHDYICENAYYATSTERRVHSSEPFFIGDCGMVCEGYAKTFKILCDHFNIPCVCVGGEADTNNGTMGSHMWNYVQMGDGNWYLVDATWDDQDSKIYYTYFLAGWSSEGFYQKIETERVENPYFSSTGSCFVYPALNDTGYADQTVSISIEMRDQASGELITGSDGKLVIYYDDNNTISCDLSDGSTAVKLDFPLDKITASASGYNSLTTEAYESAPADGKIVLYLKKICEHQWVENIEKAATCTTDGTIKKTCTLCGEEETEIIAATGHQWEADYTVDKEATCMEEGSKSIHCEKCDATKDAGSIPMIDHIYADWVEITAPGCESEGLEQRTCTMCGKTEEKSISATGHIYGDWKVVTEPDCTTEGLKERVCTVCGERETEKIAATGHQWEADYTVDKEATCTAEGSKSIHCEKCDATKDAGSIPMIDHIYGDWVERTAPGCETKGLEQRTCTVCGKTEENSISATGHTYGDWEITTAPGCATKGEKTHTCSVCGKIEKEEVDATGEHEWEDEPRIEKEATCEEDGLRVIHCKNCEATEEESIPATGHTYGDWEITTAPSCAIKGEKAHTCLNCGKTEKKEVDATGEHEWEDDPRIEKAATCEEDGLSVIHCKNCEATKEEAISATGHTYEDWKVVTEPGCATEGLKERICTTCGEKETEKINATGHQWETGYTVDTPATCTKSGSRSIHCKNCDAVKSVTAIPATGHTYGSWVTTRSATAVSTGSRQCKCTVCNAAKTETISKLTPTITLSIKTIPLKVKQSTTVLKVSGLAKGDSVRSYKSSNTKVAVVNSKGKITAKKKGTAKITVTLKSGKTATAMVKVQSGTVKTTKIKVSKTKLTLKKGKSYTLKTVLTPLTSQQKVTYASANKKIATVSSSGKIVAKKKGTVKITVKSGSKKVTVTVTVK